jgi:hypothetical protein
MTNHMRFRTKTCTPFAWRHHLIWPFASVGCASNLGYSKIKMYYYKRLLLRIEIFFPVRSRPTRRWSDWQLCWKTERKRTFHLLILACCPSNWFLACRHPLFHCTIQRSPELHVPLRTSSAQRLSRCHVLFKIMKISFH